jgi:4-amino-4-deoxy-L-arabinose transferase-like glycosyltransferase
VKQRLGDLACVVGLAALLLLAGLARYRDGIDLGDEGWLATGAVRVLGGELPSRDFFATQPPLSFYSVALAFQAFGSSIATVRGLGLALYVLIPLLLYGIARQIMGRPAALLAAAPAAVLGISFFQFSPRAVWHGIALSLVSTLLALRGLAGPGPRRGALCAFAGAAAALALVSRLDVGAFVCAATVATAACFLPRGTRPRFLLPWTLGLLGVLLPLALFWWSSDAVRPMFQQLVVFLAARYSEASGLPFPRPRQLIPLASGGRFPGLFFFGPPLALAAAAFVWARRARRRGVSPELSRVAFVIALAALFDLQVLVRADPWHLVMALPPTFVVCGWLFERMPLAQPLRWVALALAAAGLFAVQQLARPPAADRLVALDGAAAGVRVPPADAAFLRTAIEKTQVYAPADRAIFVVPYQPMMYLLAERRNPTRWNYLWPGDQSEDDLDKLVEDLQRDPPAVVLVFRTEGVILPSPLRDLLASSYRLDDQVGALDFYLPLPR